jgi:hypothetical protein
MVTERMTKYAEGKRKKIQRGDDFLAGFEE